MKSSQVKSETISIRFVWCSQCTIIIIIGVQLLLFYNKNLVNVKHNVVILIQCTYNFLHTDSKRKAGTGDKLGYEVEMQRRAKRDSHREEI